MHTDALTLARARLALGQAVRDHLFEANINLIDFGHPFHGGLLAEDELAIRFHTYQKLSGYELETAIESGQTKYIPESIAGFKTDVIQGTYRTHQWWWGRTWRRPLTNPRAARADPMRGGISISDERHNSYGTLGALVVDRQTGEEMILSNWHVLAADWLARPGQRIYQPGRLDGGSIADTVATLTRDAMSVNLDAAVARLNGSRRLINDQSNLQPVTGVRQGMPGMQVVKSGRRTGITYGRVTAVEGIAKLSYASIQRVIRHVVTIDPNYPFDVVSGPGDSGSVWLLQDTLQAVGLHFAGSDYPERALAIDIGSVLNALNVDLVTTAARPRVSKIQRAEMPATSLFIGREALGARVSRQESAFQRQLGQSSRALQPDLHANE